MNIEIWSDVVCPWCYLGKRRLESALERFAHGDEVEVTWRSFELDPAAQPRRGRSAREHLAAKYGMTFEEVEANWRRLTDLAAAEGLEYHLDRTQGGNSFDAHRLLHLAGERDLQDAFCERLFHAYFTDGEAIGERDVVRRIALDAGLDGDEVDDVLGGERFAESVRADEQVAAHLGIQGVPFFAVDGRYGVSGAQPAELLVEVLERAWQESHATAGAADGAAGEA